MTSSLHLESLLGICPTATLSKDDGVLSVLMPNMPLQTPSGIEIMDVVLCPQGLGAYATRLLLDRKVESKRGLNWQVVPLRRRMWHAWSWSHISADQPWLKIFFEHARVLR